MGPTAKIRRMRETPEDIAWLQELLDRSYASAGRHHREIHSDRARLTARQVVDRLQGMRVFVVATVTSDGRPLTGPVDSFLYRGEVRFGTSPNALRARHIARSPAVSATYVEGEGLVVTVHGDAEPLDLDGADSDFTEFLRDHYGADMFDQNLNGAPYYRIAPRRFFAADMSVYTSG